jgi:hypothetical protein
VPSTPVLPDLDTGLDFRSECLGKDPDAHSPTLRRYHRELWSRPLPSGSAFVLEDDRTGYLRHSSELGQFWLTSDAAVPTFRGWKRRGLPAILEQVAEAELDAFEALTSTIGGRMLFPSWTGVRGETINQAKGWRASVADRLDLALECVRRWYAGEPSPMAAVLDRYAAYFGLFATFEQYAGYFLLDDLLGPDGRLRFLLPFDDFSNERATPRDLAEYLAYRDAATAFVTSRNLRIAATT